MLAAVVGRHVLAADPTAAQPPYAQWALQKLYDDVRTGYRIAPVPLKTEGKDWTLVGLGSYLVNAAGGCGDCHTYPNWKVGGNPYLGQKKQVNVAGYMAGGRPFGPGVISLNLTPDRHGNPAGVTQAQFIHLMRTGQDPRDPSTLLQVMPWPDYQDLSDTDLTAIYAYLRTIPARPNNY